MNNHGSIQVELGANGVMFAAHAAGLSGVSRTLVAARLVVTPCAAGSCDVGTAFEPDTG